MVNRSFYDVASIEKLLDFTLPNDFLQVVIWGDYFDLDYDVAFISLFPVEELPQVNEEYEISQYAPNFLIIGTDGGGVGVFYSRTDRQLYSMPVIGMESEAANLLAKDFVELLNLLKKGNVEFH